jgi:hypothetical protein
VDKLVLDTLSNQMAQSPRQSTFFVFPFNEEFIQDKSQFEDFTYYIAKVVPNAGDGFALDDEPECKIQIYPFHLYESWQMKSPWPTMHLLCMRDLNQVRREDNGMGDNDMSKNIRKKNEERLKSNSTLRELNNILFKLTKFP